MLALLFEEYGGPDVLRMGEVAEPHAGPGQDQVRCGSPSGRRV
jgi:hypothetical protein